MAPWRARIDTVDGATLGAGSLVTNRILLTCAHVVEGLADVAVTFPGVEGAEGLPAFVETVSQWAALGDPGDVALLHLRSSPGITPARPVVPKALSAEEGLRAYGFRHGLEDSGSFVTLNTAPDMMQRQEWWQLDVDLGRPERLHRGFSGAGVYRPNSDELVGMVTDADLGGGGSLGRMLPMSTLRRYWEKIDDLLDLSWLTREQRRELHEIVSGTAIDIPLQRLYVDVFPGPAPARPLRTVWDSIRYVAEERYEDDRLARFLARLTDYLPTEKADKLERWLRATLPDLDDPQSTRQQPISVIIRLDPRTKGGYDLVLSTLVNGRPCAGPPTVEISSGGPRNQVEAAIRDHVERVLPTMIDTIFSLDWMIEFALPRTWLGRAVEQWRLGDTLMLEYPVIVRDVEGLKPAFRQRRARAVSRWTVLGERVASHTREIDCRHAESEGDFYWSLTDEKDIGVLVYAQRPRPPQLAASLRAGIPVMVWSRIVCTDLPHESCTDDQLLTTLATHIGDRHPDELPKLVRDLRVKAMRRPKHKLHCGRRLTLLWDDPTRLPDPPLDGG